MTTQSGTYAAANPVRYSTKYWDDETGLGYWGYRYYSPSLGRWLSRDPIEERGGADLYQYVYNHPTSGLDPIGLKWLLYPTLERGTQTACCRYEHKWSNWNPRFPGVRSSYRQTYERTETCPVRSSTPEQCCACSCSGGGSGWESALQILSAHWGACCSCRVETRRKDEWWLIGNWPQHLALFVKCSNGTKWDFQFPNIGYQDKSRIADVVWTMDMTDVLESYCVSCDTADKLMQRAQNFPMNTPYSLFWSDCYWAPRKLLSDQKADFWVPSDNCPEIESAKE